MASEAQVPAGCPGSKPPSAGRQRALLIGINYTGTRARLTGCIKDVHNMKQLLLETYGWKPDCIRTLTDDDQQRMPTRRNIEKALQELVKDARPGDTFFILFSGHGSQKVDPNGFEEDGMNETILPVDFQRAGMITDDQISDLIVKPLPPGVRLTAVMDSCHSGTGLDLPFTFKERQGWREETNPFHSPSDVQLFSGCVDSGTSSDCRAGGAMTNAFCEVLRGNPYPTYPELMHRLQQHLIYHGFKQKPQLTSTQQFDLNRPFFLTDAVPNQNSCLGRIFRRRFEPCISHRLTSGPLAEMLAAVGGLILR